MKYIILEKDDLEVAILFPELIQHREAINRAMIGTGTGLVAAGFCSIRPDSDANGFFIDCWGESDSLSLKSRGTPDIAAIQFSLSLPALPPPPSVPSVPSCKNDLEVA